MTPPHPMPQAIDPASAAARRRVVVAAVLLLVAGGFTLWTEVQGRGSSMAFAYPIGFALQLFFGLIALHAASHAWAGGAGRVRTSALLLGGCYAAVDALHYLLDTQASGAPGPLAAGAIALTHLSLVAALFRLRLANALWLGSVTFLIKVAGLASVPNTLYTLFV
ncbi:MAG: hypothetical protein HRU76_05675 [Phycisphaeraceae bacterium]|nr:hypothetical protein [Phycisphaerales bacterium]QOJ17095.1 MAG: hypothetical protein HRU76_05675 [Phycisphaeraceae bacterium]